MNVDVDMLRAQIYYNQPISVTRVIDMCLNLIISTGLEDEVHPPDQFSMVKKCHNKLLL